MSESTGQKHTEEYSWSYARTNSKGKKIFRNDTKQTAEYAMDYLDSKQIEYDLKRGGSMLWVYHKEKAYSYYYTTGRWAAYTQGAMPKMHFSSKGIKDFVERFLTKYDEEEIKDEPTNEKYCTKCGVTKSLDEFYRHKLVGYETYCKPCQKKNSTENEKKRMYVNGKVIPKTHPLHKPGRYKGFTDAAFSSLKNYEKSKEGEVYIIHNPAFPGWVKVGMAVDAQDRVKHYQTSSPYRDYELVKSYKVPNRRKAEAKAHEALTVEGRGRRGEWFYMGSTVAVSELDKLFIIGEQLDLF